MKQLKELYKKYTRTRSQRSNIAVFIMLGIFVLLLGILIPPLFIGFAIVLIGMFVVSQFVRLVMYWIEKGDRY